MLHVWTDKQNVKCNQYTWSDNTTDSRLDYFLCSKVSCLNVTNIVTQTVITNQRGKRLTDHKAIVLTCAVTTQQRGPGYFKLNVKHLNDKQFQYDIENVVKDFENDNQLGNISMSIKWDILKNRLKECSIKYGIRKAKLMRNEIKELEDEMHTLDKKLHLNRNDIIKKELIQNKLFNLYKNMSDGAKIRARVEDVNEVESNEKLFKSIECSRQAKKVIESLLTTDGRDINDPSEILNEMGKFYSKLYTSKSKGIEGIDNYLKEIKIENVLSDNDRQSLEKMPNVDEIETVLNIIKENKSPGTDGLPIEKLSNILL